LTSVADLIIAVFNRLAAKRGLALRAWCVMPDHLHVVIETGDRGATVEGWLRYAKRETERRAGRRLWQRSFWDRDLRGGEDAETAVAYVLDNPVRKQLCSAWTEWPWSWSAWHADGMDATDPVPPPPRPGGVQG
jgi:REP element-mobilizing transposase RayT